MLYLVYIYIYKTMATSYWYYYFRLFKNKVIIKCGPHNGQSVFAALSSRFKNEVAASDMGQSNFETLYHIAADTLRVLRQDYPEYIPDVILLAMPRSETAWGTCFCIPQGLPVLKSVSEDSLQQLLQDMSSSGAMQDEQKTAATSDDQSLAPSPSKPALRKQRSGKMAMAQSKRRNNAMMPTTIAKVAHHKTLICIIILVVIYNH